MKREPDPTQSATSRRGFLAGVAASATPGGIAGFVGVRALEKRHRAPAGPFFGQRSPDLLDPSRRGCIVVVLLDATHTARESES